MAIKTNFNLKPTMEFAFRISVDSCLTQRFTEEQIKTEIKTSGVTIERGLLIRKRDGAVMGEFLYL